MSGKFYYPEIMAPGVALFDYDNDGDLDVFLVQGQMLGTATPTGARRRSRQPLERPALSQRPRGQPGRHAHAAFHRRHRARAASTRAATAWASPTGDFNNDGCVDLYLTNLGPNQLFRNNCDGTFTDVSKQSGTDDPAWSVSAAFVDYDRDGWLDLFVGNYLQLQRRGEHAVLQRHPGGRDYCPPNVYQPQPSRLYHNNRDGTFTDVTAQRRHRRASSGRRSASSTADFNGDGWIDIYVANDGQPNQLWINQRNGTFKNTALLSGAALSARRARPRRAWASTPATSTTTATKICSSPN